ncbi:MAG: flagellar protein FlaG [Gammaproteobacteria bacterium]|nr:flagellar protein FlaG [Gammaproteobacteria bacterium]
MANEISSITSKIAVGGVADETNKGESVTVREVVLNRQEVAESRKKEFAEQAKLNREKLDKVVSELKEYVQTMQRDLNFHVDDATGRVVVRVVETSTNKVVRQIPEEEVLALARRLEELLDDMPKGMLLEGEA